MRANFVGRSVVSAMTHTPASGPLGPLTTPPMALPSIFTAPPTPCWALSVPAPAQITAIAITATPRYRSLLIFMALLLSSRPTIDRALPTGQTPRSGAWRPDDTARPSGTRRAEQTLSQRHFRGIVPATCERYRARVARDRSVGEVDHAP